MSWDQIKTTLGLPPSDGEEAVFKLPLDRIRVTSVDNFWSSVDATATMGRPLVAQAGSLTCMGDGSCTDGDVALQYLATDLKGTVVILPRAVPKVGAGSSLDHIAGHINFPQPAGASVTIKISKDLVV